MNVNFVSKRNKMCLIICNTFFSVATDEFIQNFVFEISCIFLIEMVQVYKY